MIEQEQTRRYLEALADERPDIVIARLDVGSVIRKSMGLSYEIDDSDIDRTLGEFPEGAVPYGLIHMALRSSQSGILKLYDGSSRIPFSQAVNAGVGECLEKAALVQLSAQRGGMTFLITGCLGEDGQVGVSPHAYNVVFREGTPFLVDAQNPLAKNPEGNVTHPYIAPILGIGEDYGEFIVPQEWRQGRAYSIS
jgi:hypothetical protein